jgi:hypothetical protein
VQPKRDYKTGFKSVSEGRLEMKLRISLTTALIIAAILAVASPACAKIRVKVNAEVSDDKIKNTLQESMKSRLNSTERYTVTDSDVDMELLMQVDCVVLENEGGIKNGIVCHSDVIYYPYKGSQLASRLEKAAHMAVSGIRESSFVIEKLMDQFLNGTTDSELAARKKFVRSSIQLLCSNHPNECEVPVTNKS